MRHFHKIKTDHLLYVGIAMLGAAMSTKLLTEQGREVCGILIAGATAWKAKRSANEQPLKPEPPKAQPIPPEP